MFGQFKLDTQGTLLGPKFESSQWATVSFCRRVVEDHRHRPEVRLAIRVSKESGRARLHVKCKQKKKKMHYWK